MNEYFFKQRLNLFTLHYVSWYPLQIKMEFAFRGNGAISFLDLKLLMETIRVHQHRLHRDVRQSADVAPFHENRGGVSITRVFVLRFSHNAGTSGRAFRAGVGQ